MSSNSIYSQVILSKTGIEIPVLKNGKTVDSRYDPERESSRLLETIKPDSHFIIVTGIASGTLINVILQNRSDIFILGVEKSQDDIEFLKQLKIVKELSGNKRIAFCTIQELQNKIIELYVPAFYGSLQVIEQRGWSLENADCIPSINESINKATGIVSADYSVQCHFGKLWQHNILSNLKYIEKSGYPKALPVEKTAIIFAAGPSVDNTIKTISSNPQEYFIIATDTALSILTSYNIIPDAVVSIDGQNISNVHFIHNLKYDLSKTLFLFDLCANSSAVKTIINNNGNLCFFTSGHPFCEYINRHFSLELPSIFSGAGTVTISAVDFAIKAGFKRIQVAGADFSYLSGKPYAKGTYLDRIYNQKSNKLNSIQKQFSGLEYRTELISTDNSYTTQILQAYKFSFESYLQNNGFKFTKDDSIYTITDMQAQRNVFKFPEIIKFNGKQILEELKNIYSAKTGPKSFDSIYELAESDISLLPLISWLRNNDNKERTNFMDFYEEALNLFKKLGGN